MDLVDKELHNLKPKLQKTNNDIKLLEMKLNSSRGRDKEELEKQINELKENGSKEVDKFLTTYMKMYSDYNWESVIDNLQKYNFVDVVFWCEYLKIMREEKTGKGKVSKPLIGVICILGVIVVILTIVHTIL